MANIKYPEKLNQLLKLLAYQVGQLVSLQEFAITLQIHREALLNYISLLEKSFVIFRLSGFRLCKIINASNLTKFFWFLAT
ncbi:MAG: hypothetical protein L3J11_10945 [Draconibacterium sp.]|nr:hypothetical protein [Draconibacterium sp.]